MQPFMHNMHLIIKQAHYKSKRDMKVITRLILGLTLMSACQKPVLLEPGPLASTTPVDTNWHKWICIPSDSCQYKAEVIKADWDCDLKGVYVFKLADGSFIETYSYEPDVKLEEGDQVKLDYYALLGCGVTCWWVETDYEQSSYYVDITCLEKVVDN